MLPWVVADAGAFLGDTVTTLLTFHPIKFANTWYLYALNEHGVTLPFWVTGATMVGVVAVAAYAVWRRRPGTDELLRWLALVLARGQPGEQAGLLQPVLARGRPGGRVARPSPG